MPYWTAHYLFFFTVYIEVVNFGSNTPITCSFNECNCVSEPATNLCMYSQSCCRDSVRWMWKLLRCISQTVHMIHPLIIIFLRATSPSVAYDLHNHQHILNLSKLLWTLWKLSILLPQDMMDPLCSSISVIVDNNLILVLLTFAI